MQIKLFYFGMIAEAINKTSEEIMFSHNELTVNHLKDKLEERSPKLKEYSYKIAVNQTLVEGTYKIKENDEIALLPPFAGG